MKRLAILLAVVSTTAMADCYVRVSTNLTKQTLNSRPTDIMQFVTTAPQGYNCVLRYRIHINDSWQTVEGEGTAKTETEACVQAIRPERAGILQEIELDKVNTDTRLVCSDREMIQVRKVKIGEKIWESETDIHILPQERPYFTYKGTTCRWFIEREGQRQNMILYQGIICKTNNQNSNSRWLVVDKF